MSITEFCLERCKDIDMNVADSTSNHVKRHGDDEYATCTGLTPDALPKVQEPVLAENSQTGVSTSYALLPKPLQELRRAKRLPHWYVLRATYGQEKKAYEYLVEMNVEVFYPTVKNIKIIDGKRKNVIESRLPNILFARGTEDEIKSYVYDNVNLPFLRFYYRHSHNGAKILKTPLIVPDNQMESLKIISSSEARDILLVSSGVNKFKTGQTVRVTKGIFKGVIGKVARYHGQQRVAVVIDGLLTIASAYVPSAFLEEMY